MHLEQKVCPQSGTILGQYFKSSKPFLHNGQTKSYILSINSEFQNFEFLFSNESICLQKIFEFRFEIL